MDLRNNAVLYGVSCISVSHSQHLSVCLCSCVPVPIEDEDCKMGKNIIRTVQDGGEVNHTVNEVTAVHNGVADSSQHSVVQCNVAQHCTE
jgi:hypothetical protein